MYAFGHGQPAKAQRLLTDRGLTVLACTSCDRCRVRCALDLDVRTTALELARSLDLEA
jgi:heterodisulfide reductase subunit C